MGLFLKKELPFGVCAEYWKITSVDIHINKKYFVYEEENSEVEFILSGYVSKQLRDEGKEAICNNTFKCYINIFKNSSEDIRKDLYDSVKLNPEWYSAIDD